MSNFSEKLLISLSRGEETSAVENDEKRGKPTQRELLLWKIYKLTPEELEQIEEDMNVTIEKDKPKRIKMSDSEKEEKALGLDSKVKRYLDKKYKGRKRDDRLDNF